MQNLRVVTALAKCYWQRPHQHDRRLRVLAVMADSPDEMIGTHIVEDVTNKDEIEPALQLLLAFGSVVHP